MALKRAERERERDGGASRDASAAINTVGIFFYKLRIAVTAIAVSTYFYETHSAYGFTSQSHTQQNNIKKLFLFSMWNVRLFAVAVCMMFF